jgi:hypothetical protein
MAVTLSRRSSRTIQAARRAGIDIDMYDSRVNLDEVEQEQVDTF